MSTQFESVRNSVQAIRAWGSLEKGFVQVCLSLDAGPSHRPKEELDVDDIADIMFDSDVWIGDIYYLSGGQWFSQFGIIKSLTGLTNKTIGGYIEHLDKAGQLFETEMSTTWEECFVDNGTIICLLEDEEPEEFVVEDTTGPEKWEPKDEEKFNEWMDNVIRIIGEVADASPEELEKLGENIKQIGKELKDDLELDDEPWEDDEEDVIETPVKLDESPMANQIIQEAAEKISKTCPVNELQQHTDAIVDMVQKMQLMSTEEIEELWDIWTRRQERLANQGKPRIIPKKSESTPKEETPDKSPITNKIIEGGPESTGHITRRSWGPKHSASFHGDDILTEQEIHQGQRRHKSFLDRIRDEMVFCEPMGLEEIQKRWEKTCRDMSKEWQRHAMERRHKEQEKRSRWDLFNGLTGKTPPWPILNPREPEFWEPEF